MHLLSFFLLLLFFGELHLSPASPRPNILLIVSDDHAWTDYSFMGHPHVQTPHIDRLARESLTFTRGYVPSSVCAPSLASIITGKFPHRHKITSNDPPRPQGMTPQQFYNSDAFRDGREIMNQQMDRLPTLPRVLGEAGYLSLQTGKWWQGHFSRGGFTHGMTQGKRHGDAGLVIGRETLEPIYNFVEEAKKQEKPFLIWYAPFLPHDPHTPPERLLAKYKDKTPSLHIARYWAMVEWFDETVGELLTFLDQKNLASNTIVVYVTDNGWIQNPDNPRYHPRSKQSQYDAGLRTPIMIRWPSRIQPHQSSELASSIDLMPTLLRLANVTPPADLPGVDLLDQKTVRKRNSVSGACFTHDAVDLQQPATSLRFRWMIEGQWKLIVPDLTNVPNGQLELFHLGRDPHEEQNLAEKEKRRLKAMIKSLDQWWNPQRAIPLVP